MPVWTSHLRSDPSQIAVSALHLQHNKPTSGLRDDARYACRSLHFLVGIGRHSELKPAKPLSQRRK
jgi:hypothetical protein